MIGLHGKGMAILACPKPFNGSAAGDQECALRSWRHVAPEADVCLFGDVVGAGDAARRYDAGWCGTVNCSESGVPLFGSIAAWAEQMTSAETMVYLNADLRLTEEFCVAVSAMATRRALGVGRRTEIPRGNTLAPDMEGWREELVSMCRCQLAVLQPPTGTDYFVFRRGEWLDCPKIVIGRAGYDNALIAFCLKRRVPVVDMSRAAIVIHAEHDYGHLPGGIDEVWHGADAKINRLAIGSGMIPTVLDATERLTPGGGVERSWDEAGRLRRAETIARFYLGMEDVGQCLAWAGRAARSLGFRRRRAELKLSDVLRGLWPWLYLGGTDA